MKKRINQLIRSLKSLSLDGFLVASCENIEYLTGFKKGEGYLFISANKIVYFTNRIYSDDAKKYPFWDVVVTQHDMFDTIAGSIQKTGVRRLGFEAKKLTFLEYKKLKEKITSYNVAFLKTIDVVAQLRAIKTKTELTAIKKAVAITEEALAFARELIDCGNYCEKTLALEIDRFLRLRGDNETAFDTIVAYDTNAAYPHYHCGDDKLRAEKSILIDLGAKCCGYCADLTRVFFLDKMPNYYAKKVYNIVKRAQEKAIQKIRAGARACDVDRAARSYIEKKGFQKYFGHGLGHGVGICVHEEPYLNPYNRQLLKENMVVTIEPGIYMPGRLGIRLESIAVVKSKGAEVIDGNFYWQYKTR